MYGTYLTRNPHNFFELFYELCDCIAKHENYADD